MLYLLLNQQTFFTFLRNIDRREFFTGADSSWTLTQEDLCQSFSSPLSDVPEVVCLEKSGLLCLVRTLFLGFTYFTNFQLIIS